MAKSLLNLILTIWPSSQWREENFFSYSRFCPNGRSELTNAVLSVRTVSDQGQPIFFIEPQALRLCVHVVTDWMILCSQSLTRAFYQVKSLKRSYTEYCCSAGFSPRIYITGYKKVTRLIFLKGTRNVRKTRKSTTNKICMYKNFLISITISDHTNLRMCV